MGNGFGTEFSSELFVHFKGFLEVVGHRRKLEIIFL
jgi:hypothetical protein